MRVSDCATEYAPILTIPNLLDGVIFCNVWKVSTVQLIKKNLSGWSFDLIKNVLKDYFLFSDFKQQKFSFYSLEYLS